MVAGSIGFATGGSSVTAESFGSVEYLAARLQRSDLYKRTDSMATPEPWTADEMATLKAMWEGRVRWRSLSW